MNEEGLNNDADPISSLESRLNTLKAHQRLAFERKQMSLVSYKTTSQEVIRNRLYVGDEYDSTSLQLRKRNIGAVVSLSSETDGYKRMPDVVYHCIVIEDHRDANIKQHFESASEFIQKQLDAGVRVLVHCQAGISRSTTICIAYLIRNVGLSLEAAYSVVASARPCMCPNWGFLGQLIEYENDLHQKEPIVMMLTIEEYKHAVKYGLTMK